VSSDEQVLVVPRSSLMDEAGWHGIRPSSAQDVAAFETIVARDGFFHPRAAAELDRSLKQVIPYLVLRDGPRYFLMRRTKAGGDTRLHDLWTIGVGGHLNPGDRDLAGGLRREWWEEIQAGFDPYFELVGLINDDTTDVGSVHVGAVYIADARGRPVAIRETDKLSGAFADPDEVATVVDRMETWSALAFAHLEGVLAQG
jgi:predicted NUDIX family phosphoesterase